MKGRTLMVSDWPPSANDCGEASNHDVPDANDSGGSGHTHSKSDSCHVSIIRRCEQDDSLEKELKGFMMLCEQMGVVSPPQGSLETIHHLLVKLHFHVDMTRDE